MSPIIKYTVSLCMLLAGSYYGVQFFRGQSSADTENLTRLRKVNADCKSGIGAAKAAISKKDQDGSAFGFDLKTQLELRGQMQAQVRRVAEDFGLTLQQRAFDKNFEFIVTGQSYMAILKFCNHIEKNFKEMRIKVASWGPEQDGVFSVGLTYDLLPITKPGNAAHGKKPTAK